MDPISAAGIALSVTSLAFQAFAGCVKGYQLFIDATGMPAEYSHLRTRLRIEQSRILNWGEQVGLVESLLNRPDRGLPMNHNLVLDILWQIQAAFHSSIKVTSEYDKFAAPSPVNSPFKGTPQPAERKPLSRALLLDKVLGVWERSGRTVAKVEWAMLKKASFETLITKLVEYNDRIIGLLDHSSLRDLQALQTQSNLMLLQMTDEVGQLRRIVQAMQLTGNELNPSKGVRKPKSDLESLAAFKEQSILSAQGLPGTDLSIPLSEVKFATENDQPDREFATWSDQAVWVEWRESVGSRAALGELNSVVHTRVQDLTALLSSKAKPKAFRAPLCLGYVRDEEGDSTRYGLVYDASSYPKRAGPTLVSLRDALSSSRPVSLTQRIALAANLAEALLYLHSVNWLHKGLQSASILFPAGEPTDSGSLPPPVDLANPIISGFDFSRPDLPEELTFRNQLPLEQALYLHPDLLKVPAARSQKSHDIYSLGLILLEIALWKPVESIANVEVRRSHLPQLRQLLTANNDHLAAEVADRAGEAYSAALYTCLTGDDADEVHRRSLETTVDVGALTMETFYQDVVVPLRGLRI